MDTASGQIIVSRIKWRRARTTIRDLRIRNQTSIRQQIHLTSQNEVSQIAPMSEKLVNIGCRQKYTKFNNKASELSLRKSLSQKLSSSLFHPEMCDPSGHYHEAFVVGRSADGERRRRRRSVEQIRVICMHISAAAKAKAAGAAKKPGLQRGTHTRAAEHFPPLATLETL